MKDVEELFTLVAWGIKRFLFRLVVVALTRDAILCEPEVSLVAIFASSEWSHQLSRRVRRNKHRNPAEMKASASAKVSFPS